MAERLLSEPIARTDNRALHLIAVSRRRFFVGSNLAGRTTSVWENLRLQFYTLRKGFADEPEQASFKWDGTRYTRIGGGMSDIVSFTVHRFEGRAYVIQSAAARLKTCSKTLLPTN